MVAKPKATQNSSDIFWGSSIASPVFVEVVPLVLNSSSKQPSSLSNFGCKHFLRNLTKRAGCSINNDKLEMAMVEWDPSGNSSVNGLAVGFLFQTNKSRKRAIFLIYLQKTPRSSNCNPVAFECMLTATGAINIHQKLVLLLHVWCECYRPP
jgi:hypothetical protein